MDNFIEMSEIESENRIESGKKEYTKYPVGFF